MLEREKESKKWKKLSQPEKGGREEEKSIGSTGFPFVEFYFVFLFIAGITRP